jgi:hypothetical protein
LVARSLFRLLVGYKKAHFIARLRRLLRARKKLKAAQAAGTLKSGSRSNKERNGVHGGTQGDRGDENWLHGFVQNLVPPLS